MCSNLRLALSEALPVAIKARDRARISALRTALAAVANAEAVDASAIESDGACVTEVARRHLTPREIDAIVRDVHDELRDASAEIRQLGQERRAIELAEQAGALDEFL